MTPTMPNIEFHPPIGWFAVWALVVGAVATVVWQYTGSRWVASIPTFSRVGLAALRLAAAGALAWALAGPCTPTTRPGEESLPVPVRLLIDTSASMGRRDVDAPSGIQPPASMQAPEPKPQKLSRWEFVVDYWLTPTFLSSLQQATGDLQIYRFDELLQPVEPADLATLTPGGTQTKLINSIHQLTSWTGHSLQAPTNDSQPRPGVIVVFTDGHDTQASIHTGLSTGTAPSHEGSSQREREDPGQGPEPELFRGHGDFRGWHIFAAPVGTASSEPDLAVAAWPRNDRLLPGQSTVIEALVTQTNLDHRQAIVELRKGDQTIQSRVIQFSRTTHHRIEFPIGPFATPSPDGQVLEFDVVSHLLPSPMEPSEPPEPPKSAESRGTGPEVSLSAPATRAEANLENNSRRVLIRSLSDKIRVLVMEGAPHWETRALVHALLDDPRVALTTAYHVAPGRVVVINPLDQDRSPDPVASALPLSITPSWLNTFDVVVLGRSVDRFFAVPEPRLFPDYVLGHGGSLLLARGEPFDPGHPIGGAMQAALAEISPVRWQARTTAQQTRLRYSTDPSQTPASLAIEGLDAEAVAHLPLLTEARKIADLAPAATALLCQEPLGSTVSSDKQSNQNNGPQPACVYANAGRGKVAVLTAADLWRWSLLPPGLASHDALSRRLWISLVTYLALADPSKIGPDPSMELTRISLDLGQTTDLVVTYRDPLPDDTPPPVVAWTTPDGSTRLLPLQSDSQQSPAYRRTLGPVQTGTHTVTLNQPNQNGRARDLASGFTQSFVVEQKSIELRDTQARPQLLADLCDQTGGRPLQPADVSQLFDFLKRLKRARQSETGHEPHPFTASVLVCSVAMFLSEWWLRRRLGLA